MADPINDKVSNRSQQVGESAPRIGPRQPAVEAPRPTPVAHRSQDDRFGSFRSAQLGTQRPLSAKGRLALEQFLRQVEERTQLSPAQLFDPNIDRVDSRPGMRNISDSEMLDMVKDYMEHLPLCDLPDGDLIAKAVEKLPGQPLPDSEIRNLSLRELEKKLPDSYLDSIRKDHAGIFWSVAAAAAVTLGLVTDNNGSACIEKLGIKPKVKTKFFDGRLKLGIGASWERKFANAKGHVSLETGSRDGRLRLMTNVEGGSHGVDKVTAEGHMVTRKNPFGLDQLQLNGRYVHDFENDVDLSSFGVSGHKGAWHFNVSENHNWTDDSMHVYAGVGRDAWGGRLSTYVGHVRKDGESDNRIGAVYTVKF